VRIVAAVHHPPVWTLPVAQVQRIAAALPDDVVQDARTPEERMRLFRDADVLLAFSLSADEAAAAERLRWIQSSAVGVAELLVPSLPSRGIVITNVRGVHSHMIAEHAIALVLALRRQLHIAAVRQTTRTWAQVEMMQAHVPALAKSRLVVIGLGEIGSRVAALAAGLGMQVTGVRRQLDQPVPPGVDRVVGPDQLHDALATADAIVLAVPRTFETKAMIGAAEFAVMRPNALLVNVARGRLIDDDAMVDALEHGRLAGAGLDAFVREPLPDDHPLWRLPNVLITPHTAAFGADYWDGVVDLFLENVGRFRRGEPLVNIVDQARGY
jgi:phosphoglycerate dehydrogenase-like enzyme